MTRVGTLISALIFLAFASPSHAITFNFTINAGPLQVHGFVSGLEDTINFQSADSVMVTASPIGGLGEYAPGQINLNNFQVLLSGTVMQTAQFTSSVVNGFLLDFAFDNGSGNGSLVPVGVAGVQPITGVLVFSAVPGPLVGVGLPGLVIGVGGLLAILRRKRKAIAA